MYTDKEKLNHFNDLLSSDKAQADLDLLVSLAPDTEGIETFRMEPARYADQILFHLLDFATREDIRMNRRSKDSGTVEKAPEVKEEKVEKAPAVAEPKAPKTEADKVAFAEKMAAAREAKKAEKERLLADTKDELERTKEELDETRSALDELEDVNDELEQTKEALENAEIAKEEAEEAKAKLEAAASEEQKKST